MKQDPWHELVRNALREAPFAMRQLASESGLSYDVLRSWRSGRRHPNRESVRRLADGLAARAERLNNLSRELRRTVERPDRGGGERGGTGDRGGTERMGTEQPTGGEIGVDGHTGPPPTTNESSQ